MNLVGYFFDVHIFLIYCFLVCGLSLCLIETFSEHTFSPLIQQLSTFFVHGLCLSCRKVHKQFFTYVISSY